MPPDEILIREFAPVDAHAPRAVPLEEVPALDHEVLDHAVELHPLVPHGDHVLLVLARAELPKVFRRLRAHVREELHLDASRLHASDGDVEEHHRVVRVGRAKMPLLLGRHRDGLEGVSRVRAARSARPEPKTSIEQTMAK